jgi:hypothetical protein
VIDFFRDALWINGEAAAHPAVESERNAARLFPDGIRVRAAPVVREVEPDSAERESFALGEATPRVEAPPDLGRPFPLRFRRVTDGDGDRS